MRSIDELQRLYAAATVQLNFSSTNAQLRDKDAAKEALVGEVGALLDELQRWKEKCWKLEEDMACRTELMAQVRNLAVERDAAHAAGYAECKARANDFVNNLMHEAEAKKERGCSTDTFHALWGVCDDLMRHMGIEPRETKA